MLGVSILGVDSKAKFAKKHALNFPVLADDDHAVADAYGVWREKSLFGKKYWGIARTTFIIDPAGDVARVFENVEPVGHGAQVADALAELQR